AVPLFVFMGVVLEKSGLAEELLETMALLFGKMRGGIAISVVVVGAILAASTGIVGASVITMGLVSLPTMLRRGYHKELICGTIALIPAFALIVAVLGAIFAGVATPTEAASVGAVGGILLTMIKRKFTWGMLRNVMEATTRITSLAFIILVGANCFGLVFRGL